MIITFINNISSDMVTLIVDAATITTVFTAIITFVIARRYTRKTEQFMLVREILREKKTRADEIF